MKTITLELSERQFTRLRQEAKRRDETLSELLKARLFGLIEDPIDPFDTWEHTSADEIREFAHRIA